MRKVTTIFMAMALMGAMLLPQQVKAEKVDAAKARQVASYFMASQFGNKAITPESLNLVYQIDNAELRIPALYFFNTADKRGFVVVSGDDCFSPIVAYSTDGDFDPDMMPDNMRWFLNEQVQNVTYAQNNNLHTTTDVAKEWDVLVNEELTYFGTNPKATTKLLSSTWNQEPLYNRFCPMANDGKSVTGCVATAMAQIIYYWRYPRVGKSQVGYDCGNGVGWLEVNFAEQYYDYDLMVDELTDYSTEAQINEVAKLSYHCGVATMMDYSADGSGTHSTYVPRAFRNYFKYDKDSMQTNMVNRNITQYTYTNPTSSDTAWVNMLKEEILAGRPVYYSGHDPGSSGVHAGHAFVCDGYNSINGFLHFNWGWGGHGDSWCNVYKAQLKPQGYGGYNFQSSHSAAIGVQPPADSLNNGNIGIHEVTADPFTAAIYPNPASTQVTVSYQLTDNATAELSIFDMAGRQVTSIRLESASNKVTIPVQNLTPGIYVCRLQGFTRKFVVK
ncbi:MAG: thiol protease/hemagglutinin PrtT [Bacteroidales bacterium]|nr:thiol protease/hemagglutinin PrtT [Bacteroidales bacterium]